MCIDEELGQRIEADLQARYDALLEEAVGLAWELRLARFTLQWRRRKDKALANLSPALREKLENGDTEVHCLFCTHPTELRCHAIDCPTQIFEKPIANQRTD